MSRSRRLVGTIALLAAGASAFADNATHATENGIATAKRDFDALKTAGEGLEQRGFVLPTPSMPTLDLKTESTPAQPLQNLVQKENVAPKSSDPLKSRNWLLDAMADNRSRTGTDRAPAMAGASSEKGSIGLDLLPAASPSARDAKSVQPAGKASLEEQGLDAKTTNPLNGYMAAWMTPRDFELLEPKSRPASVSAGSSPLAPMGGLTADPMLSLAGPSAVDVSADIRGGATSPQLEARENPYLGEFTISPPPLRQAPIMQPADAESAIHLIPVAPTTATPTTIIPGAETPSVPSPIDALKNQDDAKYFKQLKRF